MELNTEEIKKLSDLARLSLTEEEINIYQSQMKEVLNYVNKINELDLNKIVESLSGLTDHDLATPRADEIQPSSPAIINQSNNMDGSYVEAPGVFEK